MKEREQYKMYYEIHVIKKYFLPANVWDVLPAANTFSSEVSIPVDTFLEKYIRW